MGVEVEAQVTWQATAKQNGACSRHGGIRFYSFFERLTQ